MHGMGPRLHTTQELMCELEGDAALNVKERIAYVRGLVEGSEFHGQDNRARAIWSNLLTICDHLADSIESVEDSVDDVEEYLEAIDLDLTDLEDVVDSDVMVEVECSNCGEEFFFEEGFIDDKDVEIMCPRCSAQLSITNGHAVVDGIASPAPEHFGS